MYAFLMNLATPTSESPLQDLIETVMLAIRIHNKTDTCMHIMLFVFKYMHLAGIDTQLSHHLYYKTCKNCDVSSIIKTWTCMQILLE